MRFDGFIGETYVARSRNANMEECINLFPEVTGASGKSKIHYLHTPGLSNYITIPGGGPVRCLWAGDDRMLAVSGTAYGEIVDHAGSPTWTPLGTVATNSYKARMYANGIGTQMVVVSGDKLYCDNGAGAVYVPTASVSGKVCSACYLDGYFIALETDSNAITISAINNGLAWAALDTQRRMSSADRIVAIAAKNKRLWMFGKRNIDVWYNSGNADFPFEPDPSGSIRCGTVLPDTLEEIDDDFFFVAEDDRGGTSVVRTQGYNLQRISTHAIERTIAVPVSASYLWAWSYEEEGHKFYVLTEPTGTYTFAYDVTTGLWTRRQAGIVDAWTPHLAQCHAYTTPGFAGGGFHFVGSRLDGKVYIQSMQIYTDAGTAIDRYRQAPHVATGENPLFYHAFHLDTPLPVAGVTLRWSNDDGATWTAGKVPTITKATNDRRQCLTWRRLGDSWDRIFAVRLHAINAPVSINDAFLEVTKGVGGE